MSAGPSDDFAHRPVRPLRAGAALAGEAARDALRRRFSIAIVVVLAIGLQMVHSCSDFGGREITVQGERIDPAWIAGIVAPVLFSLQALAVFWIAGVLASSHLRRPLDEGHVALWLARPVAREVFALARLAGVLAVTFGAAALLLGGTTAFLVARHGVAIAPAGVATLATALGAIAVAALAATASLALGRSGVLLLVAIGVPLQVFANAFAIGLQLLQPDAAPTGWLAGIDRFGPPLGTAVFAAASSWSPHIDAGHALGPALWRLAAWSAASLAALALVFKRTEIDR